MSFDLVAWLQRSALPLWGESGVDPATGMFVERLGFDARPLLEVPRRVMVQARQIFVFAEAEMRGWYPGGSLAERAGETMARVYFRRDVGWIFSADPRENAIDERRDFYAQAFVLLALAALTRLTGSRAWLDLADTTLDLLDTHLATTQTGGYAESTPAMPGARRQNPHMHLLEALLALDMVAPDGGYRRRAETIIALFEARFLQGPLPVLVEHFDDDLHPLLAAPFAFEPGHHFEWAWLLSRSAGLGGRSAPSLASGLSDTAYRLGATSGKVFHDAVGGDGTIHTGSTRLWPSTEAIRAAALCLGTLLPPPPTLLDAMHQRFLLPAADGCWIDHTTSTGQALSRFVPASSLYHLVGAANALADTRRA